MHLIIVAVASVFGAAEVGSVPDARLSCADRLLHCSHDRSRSTESWSSEAGYPLHWIASDQSESAMTAEGKFWSWFEENESQFPATKDFFPAYGEELTRQLRLVNPDLVFEISIPESGEKEFVVSADGVRALIPDVEKLVGSAPQLTGWKINAFRPRMPDFTQFRINYAGRLMDPDEMWFYPIVEDGGLDLIICHPNFTENDRDILVGGSFILLDAALGEYDVMTGIRYIDHQPLPEDPEAIGLLPFSKLREVFDILKGGQQ